MSSKEGEKVHERLFILFIFASLLLAGCMSPEKAIKKLEQNIEVEDSLGLYKLLQIEDDVYWIEKEARDVITYFRENKSIYDEQLTNKKRH